MNIQWVVVVSAVATVLSLPGYAQDGAEIGDAAKGQVLAASVCADCHRIGKASPQLGGSAGAPDFAAVANTSGITPTSLFVFLGTTHSRMPNIVLTREETADVVAYIMGLRRPAK